MKDLYHNNKPLQGILAATIFAMMVTTLMSLTSCVNERKATKYFDKHPKAANKYCGKFIIPDSIGNWGYYDNAYAGIQTPNVDTVYLPTKIGYPPTMIIHKDSFIYKERTIYRSNTASLRACRDSLGTYIQLYFQAYSDQKKAESALKKCNADKKESPVVKNTPKKDYTLLWTVLSFVFGIAAKYAHGKAKNA